MNICYPIETEQGSLDVLHGHFRLSPRFIVYNTETSETEFVENQLGKSDHGIEVPLKSLQEMSVEAAIVGGVAKCDLEKINRFGIKVFQAETLNIEENIKAFEKGELLELTQKNTHRGQPC